MGGHSPSDMSWAQISFMAMMGVNGGLFLFAPSVPFADMFPGVDKEAVQVGERWVEVIAVSYTHLTLPTKA